MTITPTKDDIGRRVELCAGDHKGNRGVITDIEYEPQGWIHVKYENGRELLTEMAALKWEEPES